MKRYIPRPLEFAALSEPEAPVPFYEDDAVTIYHGDCREILPWLDYSAILSDPPYGIDHTPSTYWNRQKIAGDAAAFDPSHLFELPVPTILWGGNHFADKLPPSPGWLIWNKRDRVSRNLPGSDAELAWTNTITQTLIYTHVWIPHTLRDEPAYHPTQKPVALMRWCLSRFVPMPRVVVDPYMGAGPVLRAAKDLGIRAIGIELERRYCEIAAERCAQETLNLEWVG